MFNKLAPDRTIIHDEKSTAPHGFYFELLILANTPYLILTNPDDPSWTFNLEPDGGFIAGDILKGCSEPNKKYLFIARGDDEIHIADRIVPTSIWPLMFPGANAFAWLPESVEWKRIWYYPTYWGI